MNGIPKFISFPVNSARSPMSPLQNRVIRRRRAQSESFFASGAPLSAGCDSRIAPRGESRWSSCTTVLPAVKLRLVSTSLDAAGFASPMEEACGNHAIETERRKSSPAVIPPRLPKRLDSDLDLDSSDDEAEDKVPLTTGMKNETFQASITNDSSPKIPRRSWVLWPEEGDRSLPNLASIDREEDSTSSKMGASHPLKQKRRLARQQDALVATKADLSRRHSSPTLTQSMAAAIAA